MGNAIRPVAATARGTTSVMTVSGATDEAMAEPIAKGPSRFRASAFVTLLSAT